MALFLPGHRTYGTGIIVDGPFFYPGIVPTARGLSWMALFLPRHRTYGTGIIVDGPFSRQGDYRNKELFSVITVCSGKIF